MAHPELPAAWHALVAQLKQIESQDERGRFADRLAYVHLADVDLRHLARQVGRMPVPVGDGPVQSAISGFLSLFVPPVDRSWARLQVVPSVATTPTDVPRDVVQETLLAALIIIVTVYVMWWLIPFEEPPPPMVRELAPWAFGVLALAYEHRSSR